VEYENEVTLYASIFTVFRTKYITAEKSGNGAAEPTAKCGYNVTL